MKKSLVSVVLSVAMIATLLTGCGSSSTGSNTTKESTTSTETAAEATTESTTATTETTTEAAAVSQDLAGVEITMLNTKSEIQTQFEELSAVFEEETGIKLEVYAATGDSPAEEIAKKYASGDAPTLIMGDPQDVLQIAEEKGVDLSGEEWVSLGGEQYGISVNDKLYGFPFCIEARGLIYNKTAIEKITGETFDYTTIQSMDEFKVLLDKLVAGGMENPVTLNKEDWSLAGHYLSQVYEEQDGTNATTEAFAQSLFGGTADLANNARFNSLMNTFDLLTQYNINKEDPLAADYDLNASYVAEGKVAFWFNGNWAWAEISEYIEDGAEMGIMPVVQNDTTGNANVNNYLCGGATKQIMIDSVCSTEEQQAAAKFFLNWLVTSTSGQDFLVNQASLIPAFSNITEAATNPLGLSVQGYASAGKLFDGYTNYPSDHWKTMGATMQKYLAGEIDRAALASEISAYWDALEQ